LGGLIEVGFEKQLSDNVFLSPTLNYKHSFTTFSNSNYFNEKDLRHYSFSIFVGMKYRL
jgi:hypothetical protein